MALRLDMTRNGGRIKLPRSRTGLLPPERDEYYSMENDERSVSKIIQCLRESDLVEKWCKNRNKILDRPKMLSLPHAFSSLLYVRFYSSFPENQLCRQRVRSCWKDRITVEVVENSSDCLGSRDYVKRVRTPLKNEF